MFENMQTYKHAWNKLYKKANETKREDFVWAKLFSKIKNYFSYRKTLKELRSKSDETLKDIGIERSWLDQKLGTRSPTSFEDKGW